MRIYNRYVLSLVLSAGLINTLLALWGQNDLVVYFVVDVIIYLAITLLYVYLNPRARRALNTIGLVLFGGFALVIAIKVLDLLSGK